MERSSAKSDSLSDQDRERFSKWIEQSYEMLSRVVRTYGRFADADRNDILHEVLITLLQRQKEFDSYQKFLAYAVHAIRWRTLDYVKRRDRVRFESELSEAERERILQQPDGEGIDSIESKLVTEHLMSAIEELPPRSRQVMLLSASGLNSFEIAQKLGIQPASVRSLLRHARYLLSSVQ